ncbi:MAG: N-acetyltransferase [Betaproteobacteria bacterium]|nr:N-acetyltransferase [Betaproteobacteria bacterium]
MTNPYPSELVQALTLRDGTRVIVRPIRPEDRQIEREFVQKLSDESKYFRFMSALRELNEAMLSRFTQIDYDREMALIAVVCENGLETEIGVARYVVNADRTSCEFAVAVADAWQHRGVGSILILSLVEVARARGLQIMEGIVMAGNHKMLGLMDALGFSIRSEPGDASVKHVSKQLEASPNASIRTANVIPAAVN